MHSLALLFLGSIYMLLAWVATDLLTCRSRHSARSEQTDNVRQA